jgi:hypothetical protein
MKFSSSSCRSCAQPVFRAPVRTVTIVRSTRPQKQNLLSFLETSDALGDETEIEFLEVSHFPNLESFGGFCQGSFTMIRRGSSILYGGPSQKYRDYPFGWQPLPPLAGVC